MEAVMMKVNRRTERIPSPETIRQRAAKIRSNWSAEERKQRAEMARRYLTLLSSQLD